MAEMFEAFHPAANPALEAAFMAEGAFMGEGADTGNRMHSFWTLSNSELEANSMCQNIWNSVQTGCKKIVRFTVPALFALSLGPSFAPTFAQDSGQQTFGSAADAGQALFSAMRSPDDRAILKILGPAGNEIITSGDPIEDLDARTGFMAKYEEMHRLVTEPNGTVTLVVGAENWPLPIPLVNKKGAWYFDAEGAKTEILFRRIGKNELAAIQACDDLVEAQKQYFQRAPDGLAKEYAQKLISTVGAHDGLFWEGTADQYDSPINPLIAYARQNLPKGEVGEHVPFNGYLFKILTSQGSHAPGGSKNYVIDGKMTAGFAFVAYPVEYHSSGVMTFIVNKSGIVFEKDLGPDTTKVAQEMISYDQDSTWRKVE
jgi:hypothetical protein